MASCEAPAAGVPGALEAPGPLSAPGAAGALGAPIAPSALSLSTMSSSFSFSGSIDETLRPHDAGQRSNRPLPPWGHFYVFAGERFNWKGNGTEGKPPSEEAAARCRGESAAKASRCRGGARPKPPATAAEGPRFAYGRRGVDAPCGNCARGVQDNGKVCMADMQDTGKIGTADTQGLDKIRAIPRRRYYGRPARLRR